MALNAFLRLKGHKQGIIKGSVTQKGREGSIMVNAANHEIVSLRDSSGLATGKRLHKPFAVTKEVDRSSPLLYAALATNENIPEWELQFWQPVMGVGTEKQDYTIKLFNASIASINFHMPNTRNPDFMKYAEYEEIAFTYQKIQWIWVDGNIISEDTWERP